MNINVRLDKVEKELLWESLVPSEDLQGFMKRYTEIRPGTEEAVKCSTLFEAHLAGIESAVPRLRAMNVTDATSLKHVLDSLPEPFRTAVIEAMAASLNPNPNGEAEAKARGEGETERV